MTLDNLQYALYLNNCILLDKIKAIKDAVNAVVSTDIDELKKLVDDINSSELTNIKQLITDLDTDLSNHTSDTIIHVTQDDKDLWNATLQNAKDYAKKLFDSVTSFTIEIIDALPTENIKSMTIYFMRNGRDNESDYYEEYMYINDKWEIIGSTFVNLAPYLLKEDFEKYQQEIADKFAKYNTSDEITNILKDYLLTQTFNDTIKNYTTTEALQKLLEEYAKTEDMHTHENKDIIDKLSESTDGNLLFNGQEIKGGSSSDITISEEDNNAIQQKDDGIFVEDKTKQINNIQNRLNELQTSNELIDTNKSETIQDTPVGNIISYMGNTAPEHYLICDGTEYNISDYPYLAQHFKNEFGSYNYFGGDGINTFCVPDLRGEFLRETGTNLHTNQGSGANVGKHQDATEIPKVMLNKDYTNIYFQNAMNQQYSHFMKQDSQLDTSVGVTNKGYYVDTTGTFNATGETSHYIARPTNTSVLYCIKYEPTYYITVGEYTVQGFEDYSEEEKIIGRWIDGRPIYRSIIITNLPSTTTNGAESYVDYPFDANIKLVTNIKATYNNVNCWTNSYTWGNANIHLYCSLYYNLLGKFIRINNSNVDWNDALAYIVIEYTKYTDEENSFTPDMLSTIVMSGNKQEDLTEEELNNLITDTINLLNE